MRAASPGRAYFSSDGFHNDKAPLSSSGALSFLRLGRANQVMHRPGISRRASGPAKELMERSQPSWSGLRTRGISFSLAVRLVLGGVPVAREGALGIEA